MDDPDPRRGFIFWLLNNTQTQRRNYEILHEFSCEDSGIHKMPKRLLRPWLLILVLFCSAESAFSQKKEESAFSPDEIAKQDDQKKQQERDREKDRLAQEYLETSAKSWFSKVNVSFQYRFSRRRMNAKRVAFDISNATGRIVKSPKFYRQEAKWEPLPGYPNAFSFEDFEYIHSNDLDLVLTKRQKVVKRSLEGNKALKAGSPEFIVLGGKSRIFNQDQHVLYRGHPWSYVPTSLGFCFGWSHSATFGGLQLSEKSAESFYEHFQKHGFAEHGNMSLSLTQKNNVYTIKARIVNATGSTSEKEFVFEEMNGVHLKRIEIFKSKSKTGELTYYAKTKVDETRVFNGTAIPIRLTRSVEAPAYDKFEETVFEILPETIRKPNASDYELKYENEDKFFKKLKGKDGVIQLQKVGNVVPAPKSRND